MSGLSRKEILRARGQTCGQRDHRESEVIPADEKDIDSPDEGQTTMRREAARRSFHDSPQKSDRPGSQIAR